MQPGSVVASFVDLVALVQTLGLPHTANAEQQAVQVETTVRGEKGQMLVLWDPRAQLLHFVHALEVTVPEERVPAVVDAIARINFASVLQGFTFDHRTRRATYRFVVPRRVDGILLALEVDRAANAVLGAVGDYLPALRAISMGGAEPDDVLAVAESTRL
jgi:hypothetical protein